MPTRRPTPPRRPQPVSRPTTTESEAGFAIGVYDQYLIESNAHERADERHGDPEWRDEMVRLGVLTRDGEITAKGWDLLNRDIDRIERNSLAWMRATFNHVRDDGHGSTDELVGSFWFDPANPEHAYLVDLASPSPGRSERIDMSDASYGDLANTAFNEVSSFGEAVLGGQITFFAVQPEDWEAIEATNDAAYKREHSVRQTREPRGVAVMPRGRPRAPQARPPGRPALRRDSAAIRPNPRKAPRRR